MYLLCSSIISAADQKLTGIVIGTDLYVDYTDFSSSTTTNTREMAFDDDLETCFATYPRSYTWCGLDLGERHIITKVGWSPRNDGHGPERVQLGMFEGANRSDFLDAVPLYIIPYQGTIGKIDYADVDVSQGFRYVRYVGPSDARCNVAEIEFYGHKGEGNGSRLYQLTNLPTVCVHTVNSVEPYDKEHLIPAYITIISENGTKCLTDTGTIRERGNYSRTFPKKPYRIKFESKHHVLGSPAKAKKWTLINNYGDKTLMRNQLAFEMSRLFGMEYTPFCSYVDVVLNGEYKGCYQLCDQIEVREGRVPVEEMTTTNITGGYLVEIDAYADQEASWFWSSGGNPVTIKYPDEDEITAEQFDYIHQQFNLMEQNRRDRLDLDSFLKHFLVGELSGNTDTYWSVFMYKHRDNDTLFVGPVWDFDLAFDNDNRTYPISSLNDWIYRTKGSVTGKMRNFVNQIVVSDEAAKARMTEIWSKARENGLDEDNFISYIDAQADSLEQSQQLNFTRWKIMNSFVHQNPRLYYSYEGEVNHVRDYVKARIKWMDNKLGYVHSVSNVETVEIEYAQPYRIYTVTGISVSGTIEGLSNGIYIVRQGNKVKKILIQK